jgi:hypothetical protein
MFAYSNSNKNNVASDSSVDLADYIFDVNVASDSSVDLADYIFDVKADKEIVEAITILEGQILPLFIPKI